MAILSQRASKSAACADQARLRSEGEFKKKAPASAQGGPLNSSCLIDPSLDGTAPGEKQIQLAQSALEMHGLAL